MPDVAFPLLAGGDWKLSVSKPENFTLLVVYRGLHCPLCRAYSKELNGLVDEFSARGVDVVLVSSDDRDRAETAVRDWGLDRLRVGFGLPLEVGRALGLYVSTGRGKTSIGIEEPALFIEPGLFIVRTDQTLYAASISTMPFARPHFKEVLGALDFILKNDYPARGEA
jgi:peroxiredoxin